MKHFVYCTTNLVNGKFYIGKHSTENPNDSYLGSGTLLIRAIKKYGREHFKREILWDCHDENHAYRMEIMFIGLFGDNYKCYNLAPGGTGVGSGAKHPMSKAVYKFNMDGELIYTYESTRVAAGKMNKKHTPISRCAKGDIYSAYGFRWSYNNKVTSRKRDDGIGRITPKETKAKMSIAQRKRRKNEKI